MKILRGLLIVSLISLCAFWHGVAPPSITPTTFDPTATNPALMLSGGNLIATLNTTNGTYNQTRSVADNSTGKFYNEFTYNSLGTCNVSCVDLVIFGIGNVNASQQMGNDTNSIGIYPSSPYNNVYFNDVAIGTVPAWGVGTTMGIAIDFTAQLIWVTVDGTNWNAGGGCTPASTGCGYSFAGMVCACWAEISENGGYTGIQVTANFGATTYAYTKPAGFSNWTNPGNGGGGGGHIFNPQAVTAQSFISSINFNGYAGIPNASQLIADYAYLGIPNNAFRATSIDPVQGSVTALQTVAASGIKLDILEGGGGPMSAGPPSASAWTNTNYSSEIDPFVASYPGSIISIEGPNEINNFPVAYNDTFATNSTTAAGNATLHFASTPLPITAVAAYSAVAAQMTVLDYTSINAAVDNNGTAHYVTAGATTVAPVVTVNFANEVLIACIGAGGGPVTGITDSLSLTWHKRAATGGANDEEEWYALGPTSGTPENDTITITQTSSAAMVADVWGARGVNTSTPFDGSAVTGSSPILISTTHANTMVTGCFQGSAAGSFNDINAAPPFLTMASYGAETYNGSANPGTLYGPYTANWGGEDGQLAEFGLYTSTQTNLSVSLGDINGTGATTTGGVVDAMVMNSATLLAITPGTKLASATSTTAVLSANAASIVGSGDSIQFKAYYSVIANPASGVAWQGQIYSSTHGDANLSGVPVITFTDYPNAGVAVPATADYNNQHFYPSTGIQPGWVFAHNTVIVGLPEQVTETGWYTCPDTSAGVDNTTQMLLLFNDLFDIYNSGDPHTYIYELVDGGVDAGCTNSYLHYGIFDSSNNPKAAAVALKSLIAILSDSGSFSPGMLNYGITGLPSRSIAVDNAGGNSILFQKSSGNYYILIWNEGQVWNASTTSDVTPPTAPITVTFGRTCTTVNVYDPVSGASPINTASNVSSIGASLIADPLIVECAP